MKKSSYNKAVVFWLWSVCFLVFLMVLIGGITRLTDSGLSMVDWKPIMGTIPPLNEVQWNEVFDKYKQFPEYQKINFGMSLSEFKFIFFWEWFHRVMGRLVGLVFTLPFLFFLITGAIKGYRLKLFVAWVLGGSQGVLGWYMVMSGLVDRPDVSHFRLAAHLCLAFIIIGYLVYLIHDMKYKKAFHIKEKGLIAFSGFALLVFVQIVYGAFVAGLDAGVGYNTFPLMGHKLIADAAFEGGSIFQNFIYNPVMIQFIHRLLGVLILAFSLYMHFKKGFFDQNHKIFLVRKMNIIVLLQVILGVTTLVLMVPIWSASLHQVLACILFAYIVRCFYFISRKSNI